MRLWLAAALAVAGCGDKTIDFPPDGGAWAAAPVPPWVHEKRLGLSDNGDDTVAFVTPSATPKLLALAPIGDIPVELEGPHHIAASTDGARLFIPLSNYVPGSGSGPHGSHGLGTVPGSLVAVRAADMVHLAEVEVDRNPGDVILTRDGKTAFVSHYDLLRLQAQVSKGLPEEQGFSTVAVVDTATMGKPPLYPVCATGHGLALSSDEKTLYVTCSQTDQLAVLDLTTHAVTRVPVGPTPNVPLQPSYGPYAVTRSPADDSLWISCNNSGELRVYDTKKQAMDLSRTVFVNGVPMFSAFLSDGKTLIAPHQGDDKVSIVDTAQAKEIGTISLPGEACLNAHVVMVTPDDKLGFLVCEGDHTPSRPGTLVALDLQARTVAGYVAVGVFPDGIVSLPPVP